MSEGIPGVHAIIVVHLGHVVLVVDAHWLLSTSVHVVVIIDVDVLKVVRHEDWFKTTFLCKCPLVTNFRRWDLHNQNQGELGARAGQRRSSESTDNRPGGHVAHSLHSLPQAHQKYLLILPTCQATCLLPPCIFPTAEKFNNNIGFLSCCDYINMQS